MYGRLYSVPHYDSWHLPKLVLSILVALTMIRSIRVLGGSPAAPLRLHPLQMFFVLGSLLFSLGATALFHYSLYWFWWLADEDWYLEWISAICLFLSCVIFAVVYSNLRSAPNVGYEQH